MTPILSRIKAKQVSYSILGTCFVRRDQVEVLERGVGSVSEEFSDNKGPRGL